MEYESFPNVGYEWNEYLLESFLLSFSRKYVILHNGLSLNNVAGAIAKKESHYKTLADFQQFSLHQAQIKNIQNIVIAEISRLPVRKMRFRHGKQPFLQQNSISNIEYSVCIDITDNCVCWHKMQSVCGESVFVIKSFCRRVSDPVP